MLLEIKVQILPHIDGHTISYVVLKIWGVFIEV